MGHCVGTEDETMLTIKIPNVTLPVLSDFCLKKKKKRNYVRKKLSIFLVYIQRGVIFVELRNNM